MPKTKVAIYREADGTVPLIEWLDNLSAKVQDKLIVKVELLENQGYELRRPHCDLLEQGIYELRARHKNVHYRILYAFVGRGIVLLSHGCTKAKEMPKREINRVARNRDNYTENPKAHTYSGEL